MKIVAKILAFPRVAVSGLLLLLSCSALAEDGIGGTQTAPPSITAQQFGADLQKGALCVVEIGRLHPTQAAVGYFEVKLKIAKLPDKTSKLLSYLAKEDHIVPIVIGPGGMAYLTDHHHLARALLDANLSKTVNAKVLENWSDATPEVFWQRMKDHVDEGGQKPVPLVYLYDENGNPLPGPDALPKAIADLKDDPYRSLVYILIDAGVLDKDPTPFSEFAEAQYYRQKFKKAGFTLENSKQGFDKAVEMAKSLPFPPK